MYVIFAFLIMYQHSGIDVCNSYTAEDILHNLESRSLLVETNIIICFGDQILDGALSCIIVVTWLDAFADMIELWVGEFPLRIHHQQVVADRRGNTEVLEYVRFMSDQIMHNTLSEGKSNMQQHTRSIFIPASDSCHTYCSWTMASHTAPAV